MVCRHISGYRRQVKKNYTLKDDIHTYTHTYTQRQPGRPSAGRMTRAERPGCGTLPGSMRFDSLPSALTTDS